jgi:putative colanic acid biosynthesis UDP-glucose lipid carrier transferase
MKSKKPTEWAGGADADLAPLTRLIDFALIYAALWLPTYARGEVWDQRAWTVATIAAVLFMAIGQSLSLYGSPRGARLKSQLARAWAAWFVGVIPILLFLLFILKQSGEFSRVVVSLWFVLAPFFISLWRTATTLWLRELRTRGYNQRAAAIVGMTELGEQLAHRMQANPWLGLEVQGYYDDRAEDRCHPIPEALGKRAGTLNDIVDAARAGEVDLIYIAFPLRAEPRINELLAQLSDTTASVYLAADFFAFNLLHARWGTLGGVPTVSLHETPGTLILMIVAIPMLVIGICVRVTSPGPALFRQRRYGLNGEVIHVLKFRSMSVTEDGSEIKQAVEGDTRVTPLGAFLRRTNLDELPQFVNVIEGTMSIVGPRPHAVAHNELYRGKIQGYMLRHKVKPGITGWAQVNGWRGETDTLEKMEKRVEHDLDYIRGWSLLWDLQIIFMTTFGSGSRRNAY